MSQMRLQLNLQRVYLLGLRSTEFNFMPKPPTQREHTVEQHRDHAVEQYRAPTHGRLRYEWMRHHSASMPITLS
jgi:hypothetical protein